MGDQKRRQISERNPGDNADHGLLDERDNGMHEREFTGAGRNRYHGKRHDRAHRVVEGGFAHHGLRHALANLDLAKNRDQRGRIGRGERRAEEQRNDQGNAEDEMGGDGRDGCGDDDAAVAITTDGDPDLFQDRQSQRRAAIEQDVARAEQHDDFVER